MITLENTKLATWIKDKDDLVTTGRKISGDIDALDMKIKRYEMMEKRLTGKIVPPKEMTDRGDEIVKTIQKLSDELEGLAKKINDSKLESVPKEMKDKHLQLLKDREVLERDRNKIALKVQKIKDRIIPLIQKEVKPLICLERLEQINVGRFDDIETAKVKDGKVVISTFNHLDEFKAKFK